MEQWEAIIERPLEQGHRSFEKILQTAAAVLNNASTNLASFEIEWVMETLLYEPVQLLSTVASRRGDDVWRKACADALKLLASAVAGGCTEQHYEHIVDLCVLSCDAELRKLALQCLCGVARRSDAATRDVARLLASFEEASQCRAPLAQLVGVLCEHHPAAVSDEVTRIWRGYLNMLENKKNTKLPVRLRVQFEERFGRDPQVLPTTTQLLELVEDQCRVHQAVSTSPEPARQSPRQAAAAQPRPRSSRSERAVSHRASPYQVRSNQCSYCESKHHTLYRCVDFTSLVPAERKRWAKKSGLCYRCLRQHFAKNCTHEGWCAQCKSSHHNSMLCTENRD